MNRLRRDTQDTVVPVHRPLRIVASGTLFLTHTLALPTHPEPSSIIRAHSVIRSRGGSASTCLTILAQFPAVEAMLVAPLGGNEEGQMILEDLRKEGVSTRYCKVIPEAGIPSAWVLHAVDTDSRTVINNNPLPDVTHEEFVSLLGPLLAPENYIAFSSPPPPPPNAAAVALANLNALQPRASILPPLPPNVPPSSNSSAPPNPNASPAPFEWLHFEGRSVKTTLSNIGGLDGLAKERKWRSHCVFSVDVGRRARQGVEALIPHADVLFLNKHYALAHSPQYAASPRAFLLSLVALAPRHALLVAYWGVDGAAVLSVPTREYFQASGWVEKPVPQPLPALELGLRGEDVDVQSVRTGSDFYAGERAHDTASTFTADLLASPPRARAHRKESSDGSSDSDGTQVPPRAQPAAPSTPAMMDDVGAQDAFVAGMIYALSRRMLPGEPYTPSAASGYEGEAGADKGRWRLEECLRFSTELAGRKGRRRGWDGLAHEMSRAGWLDP